MADIINFENGKYQWETINGKRCLVPIKDPFGGNSFQVGQVWKHSCYATWKNIISCVNDKFCMIEFYNSMVTIGSSKGRPVANIQADSLEELKNKIQSLYGADTWELLNE